MGKTWPKLREIRKIKKHLAEGGRMGLSKIVCDRAEGGPLIVELTVPRNIFASYLAPNYAEWCPLKAFRDRAKTLAFNPKI